jgi:hypothetical protein
MALTTRGLKADEALVPSAFFLRAAVFQMNLEALI